MTHTNLFVSAYSGSADSGNGSDKTKEIIMVIGITVSIVLLSGLTVFFVWKRKGLQMIWKEKTERRKGIEIYSL